MLGWMATWASLLRSCMRKAWAPGLLGLVIFSSWPNVVSPFPCSGLFRNLIVCSPELSSTRQIVKEDRALIDEDWKECISPLLDSAPIDLNSDAFSIDQYLIAKSLIASRSFEIDEYHGFGMVPLADLFNHKTGAEDVHFTSVSSHCDSDNDSDESNGYDENANDSDSDLQSQNIGDNPAVLQMIIVKDVKAGAEVFNTYGSLGNAALLHRYGFTEPDNPYDIVNIDLELVHRWSSSLFSARYSRTRVSLWRKLDYSGCVSQNSEYFEISSEGEPEIELLILLHIMLLPDEAYHDLDLRLSTAVTSETSTGIILSRKGNITLEKGTEISKNLLLTSSVRSALLALADLRESLYGSRSLEDDIEALKRCCRIKERKLYHSLILRTSERRILEKLRAYASTGTGPLINSVRAAKRKKL